MADEEIAQRRAVRVPWLKLPAPLPRDFECPCCSERFGTAASVYAHATRVHGDVIQGEKRDQLQRLVSEEAAQSYRDRTGKR